MIRTVFSTVCAFALIAISNSEAKAEYNAEKGQAVYESSCISCHKTGLVGAPIAGNKTEWVPRIAQGLDVLVSHSIKGFSGKKGIMPEKGGNASLTNQEVGDAVAYMVKISQ